MSLVLQCPFCHGEVPYRAIVCRGCHARVEYGVPSWVGVPLLVLSAIIGMQVGSATFAWMGWVTFIGAVVGGALLAAHGYRNRVIFRLPG